MISHSTSPGVTIRDIIRDEFGEFSPFHQAFCMSHGHLKHSASQNELIFFPKPFHYLYSLTWAVITPLPLIESKPINATF